MPNGSGAKMAPIEISDRSTPALAKPNFGTIAKPTRGAMPCSKRTSGELDWHRRGSRMHRQRLQSRHGRLMKEAWHTTWPRAESSRTRAAPHRFALAHTWQAPRRLQRLGHYQPLGYKIDVREDCRSRGASSGRWLACAEDQLQHWNFHLSIGAGHYGRGTYRWVGPEHDRRRNVLRHGYEEPGNNLSGIDLSKGLKSDQCTWGRSSLQQRRRPSILLLASASDKNPC